MYTSFVAIHLSLLLTLFSSLPLSAKHQSSAVLSPSHSLWRVNTSIMVNCTVDTGTCNARDIYFLFGGTPLDEYTTTLNDRTAQLVWVPRVVTIETRLACMYNGSRGAEYQSHVGVVLSHMRATIADVPVVPSLEKCINYDLKSVVCSWMPLNQENITGLSANFTLYFSIKHSLDCYGPLLDVPGKCSAEDAYCWHRARCSNDTCTLPHRVARLNEEFYTCAQATNTLDSSVHFDRRTPSDLWEVLLSPVFNLTVKEVTNVSVVVTWMSHHRRPRAVYMVSLMSQLAQDVTSKNSSGQTEGFYELRPYTEYIIAVRVKMPTGPSIWSNATSIVIRTKTGVPDWPPRLHTGCFVVSRTELPYQRSVWIYWQALPVHPGPGAITGFRVSYKSTKTDQVRTKQIEMVGTGQVVGTELILDHETRYEVSVDARNSVGYNIKPFHPQLIIPRQSQVLEGPDEVIAVRNGSLVTLTWSEVTGATGYTVYWCPAKATMRQCTDSFQWANVTAKQRQESVTMENDVRLLMAVSVQKHELTSGMTFADCIHDVRLGIRKPEHFRISHVKPAWNILLQWSIPACTTTAHIAYFIVSYCRSDQCTQESLIQHKRVPRTRTHDIITSLDSGYQYVFLVRSVSTTLNLSVSTEPLSYTVPDPGLVLEDWNISLIAIGGALVGTLAAIGVTVICRTWMGSCRKCIERLFTIKITLPPDQGSERTKLNRCDENINSHDYSTSVKTVILTNHRNIANTSKIHDTYIEPEDKRYVISDEFSLLKAENPTSPEYKENATGNNSRYVDPCVRQTNTLGRYIVTFDPGQPA